MGINVEVSEQRETTYHGPLFTMVIRGDNVSIWPNKFYHAILGLKLYEIDDLIEFLQYTKAKIAP